MPGLAKECVLSLDSRVTVAVINGPNLNLLEKRETGVYGDQSLAAIERNLTAQATAFNIRLWAFQSNHEGHLIDHIQSLPQKNVSAMIINPGGLTHTSVCLRDALLGVSLPFVEVHISNVFQREVFRQRSYISDIAMGVVCGFGGLGYELALLAIVKYLGIFSA